MVTFHTLFCHTSVTQHKTRRQDKTRHDKTKYVNSYVFYHMSHKVHIFDMWHIFLLSKTCPKTVAKTTPKTRPHKYHKNRSKTAKIGVQMRSQICPPLFSTKVAPGSPKGAPRAPKTFLANANRGEGGVIHGGTSLRRGKTLPPRRWVP